MSLGKLMPLFKWLFFVDIDSIFAGNVGVSSILLMGQWWWWSWVVAGLCVCVWLSVFRTQTTTWDNIDQDLQLGHNELNKAIQYTPYTYWRCLEQYIVIVIFVNENFWILYKIWLKYVLWGLTDNMAALVQILAWHRTDDKALSEPMFWINIIHC